MKTIFLILLISIPSLAHNTTQFSAPVPVLAPLTFLEHIKAPTFYKDPQTGLGITYLTPEMQNQISILAHQQRSCAGYQLLDEDQYQNYETEFAKMSLMNSKMQSQMYLQNYKEYKHDPQIAKALDQVSADRLKEDVVWLSSYKTRLHSKPETNQMILDLRNRLETILKKSSQVYQIDIIKHKKTQQNSLKLTLTGTDKPSELIVLGAHVDSTTQSFFGSDRAPGADDNASGSSNLIETVRILSEQDRPQRTLEFFWYAGEEGGLIGSGEIAKQYKAENKQVLNVLQLDMTLYPGNGEFVIGNVKDYTSPRLWNFLEQINNLYLNVKLAYDKCGYACSDHASWYKEGYETLLPFESTTKTMNKNIHTESDLIDQRSSFRHSAVFTKIALIFVMELSKKETTVTLPLE